MIDTGSTLLWMFAEKCEDKQKNITCGKFLKSYGYGYLDGSMSGEMISTDVYLNSIKSANNFLMLVEQHDEKVSEPLVGLSTSIDEYPSFMDKLK